MMQIHTNRFERMMDKKEKHNDSTIPGREKAFNNYFTAMEYVGMKEQEVENLKTRVINARSSLETDEFLFLMKQLSHREIELLTLKDIASRLI